MGTDQEVMEDLSGIVYSRYSLLIGKITVPAIEGKLIDQTLNRNCGSNKYLYHVKVRSGGYTALGNRFFGTIAPKMKREQVDLELLEAESRKVFDEIHFRAILTI